ncbi:MAG: glycoside hydrolase family 3 N-terminal domain-containing protein [Candidatus Promineifilaceae bacterium]|nr:glycoside hydrolase family 3 N-terminal domain-containing protein [Candidatus Promineifilaceae bacterium]
MKIPSRNWFTIALALLLLTFSACRQLGTPAPEVTDGPESTPAAPEAAPETDTETNIEAEAEPAYLDPSLPAAARAEDLLTRMTLAEKIGQMTLVEKNSIVPEEITSLGIGALLSGGGGGPPGNEPEQWLEMVNEFQEYALETPLGIPLIYGVDAVHGHSNVRGTVLFPHNVGLGATGNAALVEEIGRVTARETAATGIFWNYAPAVSVPQDIRWGRTYEGYSEDTELVTLLSRAYLEGLQGDDLTAEDTIAGTPKHFVADGGTLWGTSRTADYFLDQGDAQIDEATLRSVHLPPYLAALDAGARSIMVSYSSWNGEKMHAQEYLITDVLKGELGFDGFVVSDWGAVDQIDSNYYNAVVRAINAGIDMNMVPMRYQLFIDALTAAVENGDVPLERIDDAVRRILTVKFELGLFERPLTDDSLLPIVGSAAHRELARQAVRESLVLLAHDGETLPLSAEAERIFVAGEPADNVGIQAGGWSIEWQGRSGGITEGTTILEGIEAAAPEGAEIYYNRFGKFDHVAEGDGEPALADVGIVVVGERPYAEGVGDRDDLRLNTVQIGLIERMREQSEKLVVILISGRPLIITEQLPLADAWIAAWLPGTEGQGVADVLFGAYDFTGTLPYTWPRSMAQIPFNFESLPAEGCDAPLFPLGYGLQTSEATAPLVACP